MRKGENVLPYIELPLICNLCPQFDLNFFLPQKVTAFGKDCHADFDYFDAVSHIEMQAIPHLSNEAAQDFGFGFYLFHDGCSHLFELALKTTACEGHQDVNLFFLLGEVLE